MRDDFPKQVKDVVKDRAGSRCSKPDCHVITSGPHTDTSRSLNIGVAAHITAASPGGPRYNPALSNEQRCSAENAIWLCQNHAKLIDNDTEQFTESILRQWKQRVEADAEAGMRTVGHNSLSMLNHSKLELMDQRFKMVAEDWSRRGTPFYMIDSFVDLSREEKADFYERIYRWYKKKDSKTNPFHP